MRACASAPSWLARALPRLSRALRTPSVGRSSPSIDQRTRGHPRLLPLPSAPMRATYIYIYSMQHDATPGTHRAADMQQGHVARRGQRRGTGPSARADCVPRPPAVGYSEYSHLAASVRRTHVGGPRHRAVGPVWTACGGRRRCSGEQPRVATALSLVVRRRNQSCCQSVAAAHRVLQQCLVGSCDDATDTVANPLPQRIACCNRA
jgi:hypothetical protein